MWRRGCFEKEEDDDDCDRANGQVNIEAPSPRNPVCERASHDRSDDARDAKDTPHEAGEHGPFPQRYRTSDNDNASGRHAARSQTRNGAAENEGDGIGRGAANSRTDFEQRNSGQEDPFWRVECEYAAVDQLERTACKQVAATVPADICEGIEVVGYAGDGGCNDCSVLGC